MSSGLFTILVVVVADHRREMLSLWFAICGHQDGIHAYVKMGNFHATDRPGFLTAGTSTILHDERYKY
jgi:hypothetical protein